MIDFLILSLTFLASLAGSWLYSKILKGDIHFAFSFFSGLINTGLWLCILKYSRNSLIGISAWFDAISAFGYFFGFMMLGQSASITQIIGMILLIIGLFLIN